MVGCKAVNLPQPSAIFLSLLLIGNLNAAEPAPRPWTEYRTIMWIGDTAYKKPE